MPKNWNLLLLAVFLLLFPLAHCVNPPTKPKNLAKAYASSTTISLQWVKPEKRFRSTTSYLITYNGEEVETNSTSLEYTLTGLQPFTTYNISVAAMNAGGVGNKSTTITVETAEAVPTQPLSLNSTSTNTSVTLTWSQPEHPNGVITSYVITYNKKLINTSDDSLSYTLTVLLPFTTYTISVAARNGAGIGNKSQEAMETTKKGYPSAPRNLIVTQRTCNCANISWKASQVVGDMPDTVKYIVDIAEEAELKNTFSEMTLSRNHKAHNLTAETTYKVTVRAQNSIGLGQLAMVTFNTQPYDMKTISRRRLTDSFIKIQVKISDPSEVYQCLAEAQGSDLIQTDTMPSKTNQAGVANFADLESNTTYNIICTGKRNNCQRGNASFTTLGAPSQPTDVIVQAVTCNSAMVTWSPPFHDGGSPVQEYQVQVKEGLHVVQSILTANESLFVLNVEVDTSYMVSIGSRNSIGIGPFAMITFSTKSYDNAGITATSPSNTKIEVNIATPQTYACSAIDVDTGDSSTNNITSIDGIGIFQELKSNTEYSINCIGVYNTCIIASTTATTRIGAPDPPTIAMSPTTTCQSIQLSWTPPTNTGGDAIRNYTVTYYMSGAEESKQKQTIITNQMSVTLNGLVPNTEYTVLVRASNSKKTGEAYSIAGTTDSRDDVVVTATSSSNIEIKVKLATPQTYACSARNMEILHTGEYTHIRTNTEGIGLFQGLRSNTEYSINCTGVDNACDIANTTATTRIGAPDPPTIAMIPTTTCQSIELSWTAPINTGGDDISNYTVTYYISVPGKSEKIHTANILAITLNGLAPNTEYTVLVTASNSQQTGEADNITVRTQSRGNGDIMAFNTDSTSATLLHSLGNDAYYRCNITGTSTDQFDIPAVEGFNLSGLSADTTYTINCVAYEGDMEYCYEANTTFKTLPAAVTMLWTTGVAFHGNLNIVQPIAWERPPQHTSTLTYVITFLKTKESNTATVLKTNQTSINASLPIPTDPTNYTVSVAAKSDVGLGEAVERKISYKKSTNPGNIQTHNITCNSITVTWEAPEDTGGLELLRYRIQEIESGFSTNAGPNENGPIVIPNLLQNTRYKIRVSAINSIGVSRKLVPVSASTAAKGNIKLNIIPVSATRMTVQITPPKDGADYSCTPSAQGHNPITVNTSTTNTTFRKLKPDTNYNVACLVYENGQELCYEGMNLGETFPEVPDAPPAKVEVMETNSTAFTAAWSVPTDYEYNEDIIEYKVVYWAAGSQNKTNMTANTVYTYTAAGLVTDRSVYYFIVAAVTAKGTGVYSEPIQAATIPIIPVEKVSFRNVTTDSFSIRWEGNYTGYSIHIRIEVLDEFGNKTEINQTELSGDSRDFSVKGLAPFRQYQIDLYLTKPDETGNGSTIRKNVTTQAKKPEGKPTDTNTTSGARNVTIQWKIPSSAKRNGIITSYRIEWKSLGTVQAQKSPVIHNLTNPSFTHPTDISFTLTSLTPYTNYKWRVAAVNDKGDGPFSEYHNFTTEEDAPGIVGTITYSPYNSSSGEAKWSKPTAPNGLITTYELCYWKLGTKCDSPSNTTNSTASQEYLNNFIPGVPHVVSVTAFTSAGRGAYSTIQMPFFSQELKPNTTVQNITVNRINSTTANISWIPLTLHEARGYPEYTVQIISGGVTEFEKNTTESSILANDLAARKVYTAQVQPVTAGGQAGGPVSAVNFGRAPDEMEHDGIVIAIVIVLIILVALICIILIVIIVVFCKYKKNKGELLYDNEEMVPLKELVDESMVARQNMKKNNAIPKQQFSAHVRKMHLRKDSEFKEEFSDITREPPVGHEAAEANRTKNRYINIYPYDYSRVVLNKLDGSDYINAAFIDGYHGERRYIASQGPTPATVADFWEMVWEQQSTVIVMLTKLVEGTRVKCEQYWREDLNQPYEPGRDIRVTTTSHRVMTGFEARNITLEKTSEKSSPLKVKHFLYTAWPDHGVPQYSSSMVKFIQEQIRPEIQNSSSPIIVHCSAGAGRTGTLIAIDTTIDRLEEEEDINIFERVEFMRARRTQMVQNVNQYMYIHDAINDYVTCGNTTIVAHDLGKKIKVLNKTHPTTKMRGYDRQFQKLVDTCPEIDQTDLDFSQGADIAELNRYPDKIPYSDTEKHILTEDAEKYVNATEVKGYYGQNTFIAAQAPMKNTAEDIWNVIRERKCSVVVVLTNFRENEQEMCAEFWPSEVGVPMEIGYMKISLIQTDSSENFNKYNLSISVEEADILHKVEIYHYLSWVKDGCPNIPSLLKLMGEVQRSQQGDSQPVIVMCDDGMSRTGVFITVMSEIDRVKLEGEMDIFQTIKAARTARPYMVSTVKDFEYCHEIMQQYLESFDTYANFK